MVVVAIGGLIALSSFALAKLPTHVRAGNLVVDLNFDFAPRALPRTKKAPIRFWGSAKLRTKDGSVPPPISYVGFEINKNGSVVTKGLPVCKRSKLIATTAKQARKACPGAIIGEGFGEGVIDFPEQAPIAASAPVTFFNAPRVGGDPAVIAHAHLDIPAPTTYLVTFRIERIHKGPLGYRIESEIPKIAGGYGSITDFRIRVGRKWRFKDKMLSYINARCVSQNPQLLLRVETLFADGTDLTGSILGICRVRQE